MLPGINKHRAVGLVRQELAGEGGLARAVGGGDDDDALINELRAPADHALSHRARKRMKCRSLQVIWASSPASRNRALAVPPGSRSLNR